MLTFAEMSLTVFKYVSCKRTYETVVWNARKPLVGDCDETKYPSETGMQSLSFYMSKTDFEDLMLGRQSAAVDCSTHLSIPYGGCFLFTTFDLPHNARGVARVPYVQICLPPDVRRILVRAVRMTMPRAQVDGPRLEIPIPRALRERWDRQYGQGKGRIEVVMEEDTRAYLAECLEQPEDTRFRQCWEGVQNIARNSTWRWNETAHIQLHKYHRGGEFSWAVYNPKGSFIMNGGIIDHGKDGGKPDWSTHT